MFIAAAQQNPRRDAVLRCGRILQILFDHRHFRLELLPGERLGDTRMPDGLGCVARPLYGAHCLAHQRQGDRRYGRIGRHLQPIGMVQREVALRFADNVVDGGLVGRQGGRRFFGFRSRGYRRPWLCARIVSGSVAVKNTRKQSQIGQRTWANWCGICALGSVLDSVCVKVSC